jgi:hypothetical protein
MCDCIKTIESKTLDEVRKQKEGEYEGGKLVNVCFLIVKNKFTNRRTYQEFEFQFAPMKKDGTIGKEKRQTVNINHSYCPFCGEKYDAENL